MDTAVKVQDTEGKWVFISPHCQSVFAGSGQMKRFGLIACCL